ncbi:MAG: phosphate ABC transporter permease PstA, partial [candidate division WOR-3 bacterium]
MGKRIFLDKVFTAFSLIVSLFVIVILFWILKDVFIFGIKSINLSFFLEDPRPPGIEGGGLRNAIVGSFIITFIALIISFPIALLSAIYINEYNRKIANVVRFVSDVMLSVPSIVIGAFAYAILVRPFKTFSAISGSFALAIISIPIILKMVDELIRLVPDATKEAAYALGAPKWKVITKIILSYVKTGILTSIILAFSRIFGETAPLLFTSF